MKNKKYGIYIFLLFSGITFLVKGVTFFVSGQLDLARLSLIFSVGIALLATAYWMKRKYKLSYK